MERCNHVQSLSRSPDTMPRITTHQELQTQSHTVHFQTFMVESTRFHFVFFFSFCCVCTCIFFPGSVFQCVPANHPAMSVFLVRSVAPCLCPLLSLSRRISALRSTVQTSYTALSVRVHLMVVSLILAPFFWSYVYLTFYSHSKSPFLSRSYVAARNFPSFVTRSLLPPPDTCNLPFLISLTFPLLLARTHTFRRSS